MRRTVRARTKLWLGALAAFGVVLTHSLAYRLAVPDPHTREAVLDATGHGAFPFVVAAALGAFVAGMAGLVSQTLAVAPQRPARSFLGVALRLTVLQALGFLWLEGMERVVVGGEIHGFLAEPVVWAGVAVQVLVALAGASLVVLVVGAVELVAARLRPPVGDGAEPEPGPPVRAATPRFRPATGGPTLRAPPLPAAA